MTSLFIIEMSSCALAEWVKCLTVDNRVLLLAGTTPITHTENKFTITTMHFLCVNTCEYYCYSLSVQHVEETLLQSPALLHPPGTLPLTSPTKTASGPFALSPITT